MKTTKKEAYDQGRRRYDQKVLDMYKHPIVAKYKDYGFEYLTWSEEKEFIKELRPELRRRIEKLHLWDSVHGKDFWDFDRREHILP